MRPTVGSDTKNLAGSPPAPRQQHHNNKLIPGRLQAERPGAHDPPEDLHPISKEVQNPEDARLHGEACARPRPVDACSWANPIPRRGSRRAGSARLQCRRCYRRSEGAASMEAIVSSDDRQRLNAAAARSSRARCRITPTRVMLARRLLRPATGRPIVQERPLCGRLQLQELLAPTSSIRATMWIPRPWSGMLEMASWRIERG